MFTQLKSCSLAKALSQSKKLFGILDKEMGELKIPANDRYRLSTALFHQVFEHHRAICYLLKNGLVGSAIALVRSIFESTVRGIWLSQCATDQEVDAFKKDTRRKDFSTLITEIEARFASDNSALSRIKNGQWKAMCSFTHSGYLQAVRRITPQDIGPNYSNEEQIITLTFADYCVSLAAIGVCALAEQDAAAIRIADTFENICSSGKPVNNLGSGS
ncbi:MAG TPA: DUF5677 domain-containing protein [Gammaproteobacteria bacterium]|nr:DUF5677 domain-containing protein [Gammaproteobacteria bacterium]